MFKMLVKGIACAMIALAIQVVWGGVKREIKCSYTRLGMIAEFP